VTDREPDNREIERKKEPAEGRKTRHAGVRDAGLWLPEDADSDAGHSSGLVQLPLPASDEWQTEPKSDPSPVFSPRSGSLDAYADPESVPLKIRLRVRSGIALAGIRDQLATALSRERDAGNLFNFAPVALGLGIIAYYQAPSEPQAWVLIGSLIASLLVVRKIVSRGGLYLLASVALLFFAGMGAAKLQIERGVMPAPLSQMTANIEGTILSVDQNRRGAPRYLIRPHQIEGLASGELPEKIRVSAAKAHEPLIEGDGIAGLARIAPISGPAYPGGYDFSFASMMQGIGMSGFFMGAPQRMSGGHQAASVSEAIGMRVQTARRSIADRIRAGLPGEPGDIAVALITGDRSGLSEATQESLRRSGLAHILAISGLHMALVTLTVIWLVRLLLVVVPGIADRWPVKKIAILAGFVTASAYLLISGQAIATQRAWLMISVMLTASLLDRRAITMRSVAIAALIILLISPASLFHPGFQMSFAAVAALVAVYREWSDYRAKTYEINGRFLHRGAGATLFRQFAGYFGGLTTTSLIAGLATALFALWHFHRVAPLGLVSNLAAMPIVSVAVMPLALLAMFLIPYGFEQLALRPLGQSINGVLAVSDKVNTYGLDFEKGLQPIGVLVTSALLLIFVCALRTRLRLLAIIPLGGLVAGLASAPRTPDILIAQDGRSIAVKSALLGVEDLAGNSLSLLYPRRGGFITDIWQRAYLPNRQFIPLPDRSACGRDRCDLHLIVGGNHLDVAVIYDPDLLQSACRSSDILIAPRLWWVRCREGRHPRLILRRADFEARGSHAIRFERLSEDKDALTGWSIATAWHHPVSAFERHERLEQLQRRAATIESDDEAGKIEMSGKTEVASLAATAPRPWLVRFDNISRRFEDRNEPEARPGR
jgi:competence protein ComEC